MGTLWEHGELQYQQVSNGHRSQRTHIARLWNQELTLPPLFIPCAQLLQHQNPTEFKNLLERNGIKYDPHYRRGGY